MSNEPALLAKQVAEFAYGERRGAGFVAACADNPALAAYAAALRRQALDEERHAELFDQLAETLPRAPDVGASLRALMDACDAIATTPAAIVGVHGVLETLVGAELEVCRQFWPGARPVFGVVCRDEAWHIRFGHRYLARHGAELGLPDVDGEVARLLDALHDYYVVDRDDADALSRARAEEFAALWAAELPRAIARMAELFEALRLPRSATGLARLGQVLA